MTRGLRRHENSKVPTVLSREKKKERMKEKRKKKGKKRKKVGSQSPD